MLQFKRCIYISIKKCNNKSLSFYHFHHQTSFINMILNINKLTNSSKSILKIKLAKAKSVKNAINIVNNIINIFALLKQNTETEHSEEEY